MVKSAQDKLSSFSRDKLFLTIADSCKHRSDYIEDAAALTQIIINESIKKSSGGLIDRDALVDCSAKVLSRFDKTAATIYTAFHPPLSPATPS